MTRGIVCLVVALMAWPLSSVRAQRRDLLPPTREPNLTLPRTGAPAPDFTLRYLSADGMGAFRFLHLRQLRGRGVVIELWASWCGPCLQALPELDSLAREYAPRGVSFLAVNTHDPSGDAWTAWERLGVKALVPLVSSPELIAEYGVDALPKSVFIDARGMVRHVTTFLGPDSLQGAARRGVLRQWLEQLGP